MKTIITFSLFLLFFNTLISQNKPKEIEEAFDTEMYNFNNAVQNTHDGGIDAYDKIYSLLEAGESFITNSTREYSTIAPDWLHFALKHAKKIKKIETEVKIATFSIDLLEMGWKEHNDQIEASRKQIAMADQIEIRKLVLLWKVEFELRLDRYLSNKKQISKFEKINKAKFNKGTLKEKKQLVKELQEYNKQLKKDYPVFAVSEENNKKARIMASIGVYEAYINHFNEHLGDTSAPWRSARYGIREKDENGFLLGLFEYDKNLKLKNYTLIPKVPSGIEIGKALNELILGIQMKPLELKVYKSLIVYNKVKGLPPFAICAFKDNYVAYERINQNNPYCKKFDQNIKKNSPEESFLKNIAGIYREGDRPCNYFSINKTLFLEFTERNSPSFKKMDLKIKNLIDY